MEKKRTSYKNDIAGSMLIISTLGPTCIRDHSPLTQHLKRGGRVPVLALLMASMAV